MEKDIVISVRNVAKKFRLFPSPGDRIREALHPLRKRYHHEFWALESVSLDVHRGEVVGILGRNGSGKSTLLQIICSVMRPTRGEVLVQGRVSALLELGAGFNPEFSGRENVILNGAIMGVSRQDMLKRLPDIEAFADIGEFFDQPVKTYSSGMFVRVAFAAAIHVDPEILVVDEALSVGDSQFQHRCYQKIRSLMNEGRTILVVSHATDTLLRICDRGVVIDAGSVHYSGKIDEAIHRYHQLLFGQPEAQAEPRQANGPEDACAPSRLTTSDDDTRDRVAEKALYNAYETRLGVGGLKIVDFDLVVDGEVNPAEVDAHGEARLLVKVVFERDLTEVCFGFAVLSVDGLYVYGVNETRGLDGLAGESRVIAIDWRPHLVGGNYYLSIGSYRHEREDKVFLDVRRSFIKLHVRPTTSDIGVAELEGHWTFMDRGQAAERPVALMETQE